MPKLMLTTMPMRSLGTFVRFEGIYSAMVFENGQHCWQGPNRSIKVGPSSSPFCK